MWTEARLTEDLRELGLGEGDSVLVHSSLRAVGPIQGGAQTLVSAFRKALGPSGTLLVPTFTFGHERAANEAGGRAESLEWGEVREHDDGRRERGGVGDGLPTFDAATTPADVRWMGVFPEIVRQQSDARRSDHPAVSFAAIGANADFLTRNAPFHYPLGSDSPLARLHRLNGWILLIGVGHQVNTSLHLAEVWADVPYIHRKAAVRTGPEAWATMQGSPECSAGFGKIELLLRTGRLLRRGYVGNAESQLMRQQHVVSMAVTLLRGDGAALLCDDPRCPWCVPARKLTAEPY